MIAPTQPLQDWATRPFGKVTRFTVAVLGTALAVMVLIYAGLIETGSWALVVVGVALAATSIRVAHNPTVARIAGLAGTVLSIPISLVVF